MKILAAISSPAQEQVIEKVLRARGEWDPPWLKERRARGPPVAPPHSRQAGPPAGDREETRIEYDEGDLPGRDGEEFGRDPDLASESQGFDGA